MTEECPNCKYRYDWDYIEGKRVITEGDEKFHTLSVAGHDLRLDSAEYTSINVCPKCGILFMW